VHHPDWKGEIKKDQRRHSAHVPASPSKSHDPEIDYNLETRATAAAAAVTLNFETLAERGSLLKNAQCPSKVKTSHSAVTLPKFEMFFL
jgi:hypothetical protein